MYALIDISRAAWAKHQVARFLAVGFLNTAFGYGIYTLGIYAGLAPELALLITFAIGMVFNYLTTGRMVFRGSGRKNFARFIFAYVLIYGINAVALRTVIGLGVHPLLAQALVLPPVVLCTFLTMKLYVFRKTQR